MVLINYATKEIVAKIVYYGPGLCGKTTNLQFIYKRLNPKKRGKMISLATEADRTLFFDFLPVDLGTVQGFKMRFQLYTVPGQVFYASTRKLVLKGADALVFVADSQSDVLGKNIESIEDMKLNLTENNLDPFSIPIVFQYNKRDLKNVMDVRELDSELNFRRAPYLEAVATEGSGVMDTFKEITRLLIQELKKKHAFLDTDAIRDIPIEVFEPKPEPAPPKFEIELGSAIRDESAGEEIISGTLLGEVETITLADAVQAEAFFDDVRKGAPMEEAKQKAEMAGMGAESPFRVGERELTPDELESATPLPEIKAPEEPAPIDIKQTYFGAEKTPSIAEAPPMRPIRETEAYAPSAAVDISPLLDSLYRLEDEVGSLKKELSTLKGLLGSAPSVSPAPEGDFTPRLDALEIIFKEAMEGQDRLLLSILEAVRDSRKNNSAAHEKLEDAVKYLLSKFGEGEKGAKKKWF